MQKMRTMRNVVFGALITAVLGPLGIVTVQAFRAPQLEPLPDYDRRAVVLAVPKPVLAGQENALAQLNARVPGVEVAFEGKLGAPRFIRVPNGFLSGPQGRGRAVSLEAAAALPQEDPHLPIKAFLNDHAQLFGHGAELLPDARVTRDYVTAHNGLRTTVWQQDLDGVPVYGRLLMGHITRNGELVNLSSGFLPNLAAAADLGVPNRAAVLANPPVSAAQAAARAAAEIGETVAPGDLLQQPADDLGPRQRTVFHTDALPGDTDARLLWVPMGRQVIQLAWQVILSSRARGEMFLVLVDAQTGEPILRRCLTEYISDATYNVWTSDSPSPFSPGHPTPQTGQPPLVPRQLVTLPALNTNASPNGWINDGDNETRGNNVDAHTDTDANNQPDLPRPMGNPNRVFDFPIDLTMAPSTYSQGAVVQLFYLNNWTHDKLWELGFTEAAGNFQNDNLGRGGMGNDAVQADAQDGSGFNNANFSTPMDGLPGRMQMYIFDGPTPDRDGDFDAEVVIHEYVHGLSNRLVGGGVGMSALQSRGMGEGWSDWYGLALLSEPSDDAHAAYAAGGYLAFDFVGLMENYYFGIRRYPYSTDLTKNPLTFKDIDPTQADPHAGVPLNPIFGGATSASEVHNQGEVWCIALWEARANLIDKFGFATGNNLILQLVTDGMKLAPVNPNFLEARDAIIQADLVNNGGANFDELWAAFAKRGMGGSAFSPDSSTTIGVEEAFDLPGLALSSILISDLSGNGNGAIDFNECVDMDLVLVNNGRFSVSNIVAILSTTNGLVSISQDRSDYPPVPPGATVTNRVTFRFYTSPSFPCGAQIVFSLNVASSQDVRTIAVKADTGLLGPAIRFNNNSPIAIPDTDPFGVSSPINITGFSGNLANVTVSVHITHDFPFDLDMRLVSPGGRQVILSQHPFTGLFGANFGLACSPDTQRTTFDDKATTAISATFPPYVGSFKPDEPLSSLEGLSASEVNGVWRLQVYDLFFPDAGTIQCWSLNLSPYICRDGGGDCSTDLAVTMTNSPPPNIIGSNLTYSVTVTNFGPNSGRNVILQNPLPPNVQFINAVASQGSCAELGGAVSCDLGAINVNGFATVDITVFPLEIGLLTNTVTVTASVSDPNPTNNTATLVTRILPPSPFIVSAGTFLVDESVSPPNGGIDIGEDVTLRFYLRNIGSLDTEDLVVKLQATGGVNNPSPQQSYGVMVAGGPADFRDFSFQADGTNGGILVATLTMQDGTNDLGSLTFPYALGSMFEYANPAVVNIPDSGAGSLYPSPLFVEGLPGLIDSVRVNLLSLSHTFPQDIDALLTAPDGAPVMIMSDAGGGGSVNNVTLGLFDGAPTPLPASSMLASGNYRPADYDRGDVLPPPAPAGLYGTNFASLRGTDPNGAWGLYLADDTLGDAGRLNGGWELEIRTFDPVNPRADLAVWTVLQTNTVLVSSNLAFSVTVTNRGPEEAFQLRLTNTFSTEVVFVSAAGDGADCGFVNGALACDIPSLAAGEAVTLEVVVAPRVVGLLAMNARLSGLVNDFNPADNVAVALVSVVAASDLQVQITSLTDTPTVGNSVMYSVRVVNGGPSDAIGVLLTNTLSGGLSFTSAIPSQGSCAPVGGSVRCNLGALSAGAEAVVNLIAVPPTVTDLRFIARAGASAPPDLLPGNNAATNEVHVINPQFNLVPAGSSLVSESMMPPSGGIDNGETVTVMLSLRNIGLQATANLVGTLLNAGGVNGSSGSSTYGALSANGSSVARAFTFTASGSAGGIITASVQLNDGATQLGVVHYSFAIGGGTTLANTNAVSIPNVGRALPYPSLITVTNRSGLVDDIAVTLRNLNHAYADDLDVLIVSPDGDAAILMSDVGGGNGLTNATFTFQSGAAVGLADRLPLSSGIYLPTDFETGDLFPSPAPTGPHSTNLGVMRNGNPNGDWALYILDDTVGDLGQMSGGWELLLTTYGPLVTPPATLSHPVSLPDGRFQFTIEGTVGGTYLIEGSPDFDTWTQVGIYTLTDSTLVVIDDNAASLNYRFYRASAQ